MDRKRACNDITDAENRSNKRFKLLGGNDSSSFVALIKYLPLEIQKLILIPHVRNLRHLNRQYNATGVALVRMQFLEHRHEARLLKSVDSVRLCNKQMRLSKRLANSGPIFTDAALRSMRRKIHLNWNVRKHAEICQFKLSRNRLELMCTRYAYDHELPTAKKLDEIKKDFLLFEKQHEKCFNCSPEEHEDVEEE